MFAAGGSQLSKSLIREINEYFLFHGTKKSMLKSIEDHGLDNRLAENAMFGHGVYFAESSTKADQYTGGARLLSCQQFLSFYPMHRFYHMSEYYSLHPGLSDSKDAF